MNWATIKVNLAKILAKKITHTQQEEYEKEKSIELLKEEF
jgi:hypothetical protein